MFLPLLFLPLKSQCSHSATAGANGDATQAGGGSWWPRSVSQPRPAVHVMGKSRKRDTVTELIQLNSLWVPAAPGASSCHPSWPGLLPATKTRGKAPAAAFPGVTLRLVGQQVWGSALLLHLLCRDNQKVQSACNPSTNRPCCVQPLPCSHFLKHVKKTTLAPCTFGIRSPKKPIDPLAVAASRPRAAPRSTDTYQLSDASLSCYVSSRGCFTVISCLQLLASPADGVY